MVLRRLLLLLLLVTATVWAQENRPNIILIMADDLGFGDVGFTANNTPGYATPIKTPHLDQMASESIELLNFYSIGPVCSPTRGSFLTGRHYARFGIFAANEGVFPAEEISLARICNEKGYRTGHFGKWHIGTLDPNHSTKPDRAYPEYFAPPWERDYDRSFVTESSISTWDPISSKNPYYEDGVKVNLNDPAERATLEGDDSKVMMDRIIPFIEDAVANNNPFLSVVWFHAPHEPFVAGPNYKAMYSSYTEDEQNYFGCITAMDDQIGRLDDKLKDLGIEDNTIILFCSDNGPEKKKPGETGGLRERKRSLYNGGVLVPAFIKWPNKIKTPSESTYQTSVLDLFPTVAELIGYNMPDNRPIDGASLLPFLDGEISVRNTTIPFLHSKKMAWIDGDYKFRINVNGEAVEAYDMINDRNETTNVIGSFSNSHLEDIKNTVIDWNCSANWSYWGYDYLPEAYDPVDEIWKGLREVTCEAVPTSPMSAIDPKKDVINMFPNPVIDYITITGLSNKFEINISDLKGGLIKTIKSQTEQCQINLSELSPGSYIIELKDPKHPSSEFRKIIIKD